MFGILGNDSPNLIETRSVVRPFTYYTSLRVLELVNIQRKKQNRSPDRVFAPGNMYAFHTSLIMQEDFSLLLARDVPNAHEISQNDLLTLESFLRGEPRFGNIPRNLYIHLRRFADPDYKECVVDPREFAEMYGIKNDDDFQSQRPVFTFRDDKKGRKSRMLTPVNKIMNTENAIPNS